MKIKIDELRDLVRQVVEEAAKEGAFQKYAKSTYNKMIKKEWVNKLSKINTNSKPKIS